MTQPRPKIPFGTGNIAQDIDTLFRSMQPKRGRIFKVAPTLNDLDEGEVAWYDDETSTRRGYVKLNGALRYWTLT